MKNEPSRQVSENTRQRLALRERQFSQDWPRTRQSLLTLLHLIRQPEAKTTIGMAIATGDEAAKALYN